MQKIRVNLAAALLIAVSGASFADSGTVESVEGTAFVSRNGKNVIIMQGSRVMSGDVISTQADSRARVIMDDSGVISLMPESTMEINEYSSETDSVFLRLVKGGLRSITGLIGKHKSRKWRLVTSNATIGIRGTSFGVADCGGGYCEKYFSIKNESNGTYADVDDGEIVFSNSFGSTNLVKGDRGFAGSDHSPEIIKTPFFIGDVMNDGAHINEARTNGHDKEKNEKGDDGCNLL